jgi:hypothetical protein
MRFRDLEDAVSKLAALTGREQATVDGKQRVFCWGCKDKISSTPAVSVETNRSQNGVIVYAHCGCNRETLLGLAGIDPYKGDLYFDADAKPQERRAETLVHIYHQAILDELTLSDQHKAKLLADGWTEEWLAECGYKTWAWFKANQALAKLLTRFKLAEIAAMPGVEEVKDPATGDTKLRVRRMPPGMLIPCRDVNGHIVALRFRLDGDK